MTSDASSGALYVGPDDSPDKFRLRRMVGGGGEAQLWLADLVVAGYNEPVAVKILRPDHHGDFDQLSARWAEQAELLRFVRHPAIVGVREHFEGSLMHHAGVASSGERQLYLVMNWVEGTSLRDYLALADEQSIGSSTFTLKALEYLDQLAVALDLLHSGRATPGGRPIVHGDISPSNVMVNEDDQAVLIDFGLIRSAVHMTGSPMGTQGFAAPETWGIGQYSPAADRFSFGAVAFYLLTGAPPLGSRAELAMALSRNPALANRNPAAIETLLDIYDEDPARRPSSAQQWVSLLRNTATTTRPPVTGTQAHPSELYPVPASVQVPPFPPFDPAAAMTQPDQLRPGYDPRGPLMESRWKSPWAAGGLLALAIVFVLIVAQAASRGQTGGEASAASPTSSPVVTETMRPPSSASSSLSPSPTPSRETGQPTYLTDLNYEIGGYTAAGLYTIDGERYQHSFVNATCIVDPIIVPLDAEYSQLSGVVGFDDRNTFTIDDMSMEIYTTEDSLANSSPDPTWTRAEIIDVPERGAATISMQIPPGATGLRLRPTNYACSIRIVWGDLQVS